MEIVFVIGLAALYFLPSLIAVRRNHYQQMPIMAVNLFLGWTLIGWVVTLAWSLQAMGDTTPDEYLEPVYRTRRRRRYRSR